MQSTLSPTLASLTVGTASRHTDGPVPGLLFLLPDPSGPLG